MKSDASFPACTANRIRESVRAESPRDPASSGIRFAAACTPLRLGGWIKIACHRAVTCSVCKRSVCMR
jgi:hypothetical protein